MLADLNENGGNGAGSTRVAGGVGAAANAFLSSGISRGTFHTRFGLGSAMQYNGCDSRLRVMAVTKSTPVFFSKYVF